MDFNISISFLNHKKLNLNIINRTGVFNGKENDKENPAKYVENNVYDALKRIIKIESQ